MAHKKGKPSLQLTISRDGGGYSGLGTRLAWLQGEFCMVDILFFFIVLQIQAQRVLNLHLKSLSVNPGYVGFIYLMHYACT
jgi:hypothetical protein